MFLRSYVELNLPRSVVETALLSAPADWLPLLASSAEERGNRLLVEVGFPVNGRQVGKQVEIDLGLPVRTEARTWLPITWRATRAGGIFPILEGELEVAALGCHLTQVGLSARYKPPFGLLGESLNRALLHRVAEATVRDFIERVSSALGQQQAGPGAAQVCHAEVGTNGPEQLNRVRAGWN